MDEITQAIQFETEVGKLAFTGAKEIALLLARMTQSLFEYSKTKKVAKEEKKLNEAGEHTVQDIFLLSEKSGGLPQTLWITEPKGCASESSEVFKEVIRLGKEKGLHFAQLIDFDPYDNKKPIAVPPAEAEMWTKIRDSVLSKYEAQKKDQAADYGGQISGLEARQRHFDEKMRTSQLTPEEKKEYTENEVKLENLRQAKEEAESWLKHENGEDLPMTLQQYFAKAKDTDFEYSPEQAVAEMKEGVEIGPTVTAKEAFQPIRDKSRIPDTKFYFFLPEHGATVTRQFFVDEKTNLAFSLYAFKDAKGESYTFTDHNMTKAQWNGDTLGKMLGKAGIFEGAEMRMFDSKEKLSTYLDKHNNVPVPEFEQVKQDMRDGKEIFPKGSDVEKQFLEMQSEQEKRSIFSKLFSDKATFEIPKGKLYPYEGKLVVLLDSGQKLAFSSYSDAKVDGDTMSFSVKKKDSALLIDNGNGVTDIKTNAREIKAAEGLNIFKKQQSREAVQTESQTESRPRGSGRK